MTEHFPQSLLELRSPRVRRPGGRLRQVGDSDSNRFGLSAAMHNPIEKPLPQPHRLIRGLILNHAQHTNPINTYRRFNRWY